MTIGATVTAELALTPAERAVLLALREFPMASTDGETLFRRTEEELETALDVDDVCDIAYRFNLLHVCLSVFDGAIGARQRREDWSVYSTVAVQVLDVQVARYREVAAALTANEIEFLLPKGLVFTLAHYPHVPTLMSDIDMLVRVADVEATERIFGRLGYHKRLCVRDGKFRPVNRATVRAVEATPAYYGELFPYTQIYECDFSKAECDFFDRYRRNHFARTERGRLYGLIEFDLHYSLNPLSDAAAPPDRPGEDTWWESRCSVEAKGVVLPTLTPEALAVVLPYRFYHELMSHGGRSLKPLGDIVALFATTPIDWDWILQAGVTYGHVRPALFYVYRWLGMLAALDVPENVLNALSEPTHSPYSDWGDFLPLAFGRRVLAAMPPTHAT